MQKVFDNRNCFIVSTITSLTCPRTGKKVSMTHCLNCGYFRHVSYVGCCPEVCCYKELPKKRQSMKKSLERQLDAKRKRQLKDGQKVLK